MTVFLAICVVALLALAVSFTPRGRVPPAADERVYRIPFVFGYYRTGTVAVLYVFGREVYCRIGDRWSFGFRVFEGFTECP
jgi:hypothetical protein